MCRITAILSEKERTHPDLLCSGPKNLLAQAGAVRGRCQDDGWGIAYWRKGKPSLTRSQKPARLEPRRFSAAAGAASSRLVLAHLRYASAPGVPRSAQVRPENTQPFSEGGIVFAHNGTLFIKNEIRSLLGAYASKVKGTSDSEVIFWQVMKMLDAYGSPEAALAAAVDEIRTVWVSCRGGHPDRKLPYTSLNLFLASKDSLTVLCHAPRGDAKAALMTKNWEYGRIAWKREPGRLIFSSEPASAGAWKKMNDPEIASARLSGGRLKLDFKRIEL